MASLSGRADADWATGGAEYAGAAFLGGIALDDASREAARALTERDREEFLPADPHEFMDGELRALSDELIQPGWNVRTTSVEPLREAAKICVRHDALLEINAHCRQDELCAVGCGETLLANTDRLAEYVTAATDVGATVGVKVRAEVEGVDLVETARAIETAGGSFVHVDAMDSEPIVERVAEATDLFVIANNEVRDRTSAHEYLDYGADAVSVGRPSDDPTVLRRVRSATDEWFDR
nr:tRNA-dihydrouridine synthase [Natranaeroarchaeum aerophilus]